MRLRQQPEAEHPHSQTVPRIPRMGRSDREVLERVAERKPILTVETVWSPSSTTHRERSFRIMHDYKTWVIPRIPLSAVRTTAAMMSDRQVPRVPLDQSVPPVPLDRLDRLGAWEGQVPRELWE